MNPVTWFLQLIGVLDKDVGQILAKFEKLEQQLFSHVENMNKTAAKHNAKAAKLQQKATIAQAQAIRAGTVATNISKMINV